MFLRIGIKGTLNFFPTLVIHATVECRNAKFRFIRISDSCTQLLQNVYLRVCVLREDENATVVPVCGLTRSQSLPEFWELGAHVFAHPPDKPSDSGIGKATSLVRYSCHFFKLCFLFQELRGFRF